MLLGQCRFVSLPSSFLLFFFSLLFVSRSSALRRFCSSLSLSVSPKFFFFLLLTTVRSDPLFTVGFHRRWRLRLPPEPTLSADIASRRCIGAPARVIRVSTYNPGLGTREEPATSYRSRAGPQRTSLPTTPSPAIFSLTARSRVLNNPARFLTRTARRQTAVRFHSVKTKII